MTAPIEVRRNDNGDPVCEWGVIEHRQFHHAGNGRAHLILVRRDAVNTLAAADRPLFDGRAYASVTIRQDDPCQCICTTCITGEHCDRPTCAQADPGAEQPNWVDIWETYATRKSRVFFHLDYGEGPLTWELFEAHWQDEQGPEIYVGRWPD